MMQDVIKQEEVELDEDSYPSGSWNAVSNVFSSLHRFFYGQGGYPIKAQPLRNTMSSSF